MVQATDTGRWCKHQRCSPALPGSLRMCHVIVLLCPDKMRLSAPEDGARASATASLVELTRNTQAHPPAAGGQPLPRFEQHQAFLATLQPAIQLANPASQSYGGDVVPIGDTHPPPPWFGQPLPWIRQHHSFLGTDHPACQFAKPSAQLYGSAGLGGKVGCTGRKIGCTGGRKIGCTGGGGVGGHPRWWIRQHHPLLSAAQVFSASTAQLNGSTGPEGLAGGGGGGGVGGGVGGAVMGNGVGRGAIGCAGSAVTMQPLPTVEQQKFCCACDHIVSHCPLANPASQSNGSDVERPDNNQQSKGISNRRLRRQQVVRRQVKSRLGRTTSKSPPAPMYL